jgi:hypothetical protein
MEDRQRKMSIKIITILLIFTVLFAVPDKQMSLGDIQVNYADKDARIAEIALSIVHDQHQRLITRYGLDPKPLHIVIADDPATYKAYSGSNAPIWSVGLASHNRMLVKSPSFSRQSMKDFQQTLLHETVHLAVEKIPLPVWFSEGFAQYEAGQFDLRQRIMVSRAVWRHDLDWAYEIEYLMQMDHDKAEIMYAQSVAMVDDLIRYFGVELVGKCLYYSKELSSFEKGFTNAFLMSPAQFEKLFWEHAGKQYRYYILLDQSNLIWILAPLLLILGFILTRVRRRKILAKWAEEEFEEE